MKSSVKKVRNFLVKRADREVKEGAVIAKTSHNKNKGVVIRLSCETDLLQKVKAM
ncbi:MAG: hypothetical protein R2784_15215 [Saprospiraceae bacterium]